MQQLSIFEDKARDARDFVRNTFSLVRGSRDQGLIHTFHTCSLLQSSRHTRSKLPLISAMSRLSKILQKSQELTYNTCPTRPQHVPNTCPTRPQHVSNTCPTRAQHVPNTCAARAQHVPHVPSEKSKVLLGFVGRCLQQGQVAPPRRGHRAKGEATQIFHDHASCNFMLMATIPLPFFFCMLVQYN